jgi:hypothetical protein
VSVGGLDGLIEVRKDIADILNAHGEADQFRGDAGGGLLFSGKLLVGSGGGVNDQGFGVADVGQKREKLKAVD